VKVKIDSAYHQSLNNFLHAFSPLSPAGNFTVRFFPFYTFVSYNILIGSINS